MTFFPEPFISCQPEYFSIQITYLLIQNIQSIYLLIKVFMFKVFTYYFFVSPTNKDISYITVKKTLIKIRKITLIYFYHLILRLCSSFTSCLKNV